MSDEDEPGKDKKSVLSEDTKKVLSGLTAREEKILKERFNLSQETDLSLEEVGMPFDATGERIKQIEEKALRILRAQRGGEFETYCSFCGRSKDEVERLIASETATAYICGECVKVSMALLNE